MADVSNQDVSGIIGTEQSRPEQATQPEKLELKKKIGLFSGVGLIVGIIIGSGIFVSVNRTLGRTGSPGLCLVVWAMCGLYSFCGAYSYCELGTLVPKSGGEFIYLFEAFGTKHKFFGPILSFLFLWIKIILLKPTSLGALSLSFAKYATSPILSAIDFCPDSHLDYILTRIIATLCICVVTFVNCFSVTLATRVQNVFAVAKLSAIGIIIGGGIYCLSTGNTGTLTEGFDGSVTDFGTLVQSFYGCMWAFDGWNALNFVVDELENPQRNLPLAIMLALIVCTVCYLMVNVSYMAVLTTTAIINSDTVGTLWAQQVLGPASFLISIGIVMSIYGTTNGSIFTAGRVAYAAGREGHLIDLFSFIHVERRTPVGPILLIASLAFIMIIPGDIGMLIDSFSFTSSIFYFCTMTALLSMRYSHKDVERSIKVPIIFPIVFMVSSACLVIVPIAINPQIRYIYCLVFILVGIFVYIPFVYYKKTVPGMRTFTIFCQKLLQVAPVET